MNNKFTSFILVFIGGLLAAPEIHAQGSIYLSNINNYPAAGSVAVGSDAWIASWFKAGSSPDGYELNSIQLSMSNPSGTPKDILVMLWDFQSRQSIATLAGPDPASAGVFTYTATDVLLEPNNVYWFVVTSPTSVASGAFHWDYYHLGKGVTGPEGWYLGGGNQVSSDGVAWSRDTVGTMHFAIDATAVPEPSTLALFGMGTACLIAILFPQRRVKGKGL